MTIMFGSVKRSRISEGHLKLTNSFVKEGKELINHIKMIRNEDGVLKVFVENGCAGIAVIYLSKDEVDILKKWLVEVT